LLRKKSTTTQEKHYPGKIVPLPRKKKITQEKEYHYPGKRTLPRKENITQEREHYPRKKIRLKNPSNLVMNVSTPESVKVHFLRMWSWVYNYH